ncbi:HEAT repeat domain-containing protein [Clostridium sp.]|uniref:HEAT repeat domain-containing protein n=1 Tax=Clostridium sp. TaxID=1506 RepID=UPI0025C639F0|nr:HEAT repeat domain-containing protein [Clostridium sp.]
MFDYEIINLIPDNIEELKKKANDKTSYRTRLEAIDELKKYNCQQSRDILTRLALHDLVYEVRIQAFRAAQAMNVTIKGQPIRLGKKKKGHLIKDINKKVLKVYNQIIEDESEFKLDKFKELFKNKYPEAYDVYRYEKKDNFDKWIINLINNRPTKRKN